VVTAGDCERVQTGWYVHRANALDGAVWEDIAWWNHLANGGPPPLPDHPEFVETFKGNLKAIRETLSTMDDAALRAPMVISRNGDVLMQPPTNVFIRQIMMNHSYHHRGQLSVYLRLLDVPLPAIYGTSADEAI